MDTAAEVGVSAWYILVASHLHRDTGSVDVTAVCDSAQTVISYAWNLHNWVIIVMHGHAAVSFPRVQSLGQTTFIKCNLCTIQSQMCTIISHSAWYLGILASMSSMLYSHTDCVWLYFFLFCCLEGGGLMVFTAISRVSLIEADNDTDYSISVGQEKKEEKKHNYASFRHTDAVL